MASSNPPVTLLSLPAELRVQIFKYTLILPDNEYWISSSPPPYSEYRIPLSEPKNKPAISLLRTCKTINREASSIFYREIRFKVKVPTPFIRWLQTIGPVNTHRLKALHIIATTRHINLWPWVFRILMEQANGLRDIFISWRHDLQGDRCIRDPLANIRYLQKLVIDTSVIENFSLDLVMNSQAYLEEKMGISVVLGPVVSEMAAASCCMQEGTHAHWT